MKLPPTFVDCVGALADLYGAKFALLFRRPDGTTGMLTNAPTSDAILELLEGITAEIKENPKAKWRNG